MMSMPNLMGHIIPLVSLVAFFSAGIIIAIITYLKRERQELTEEKAYEDYMNFRSDPDKWRRYFRVQRMISQLNRVEEERRAKREAIERLESESTEKEKEKEKEKHHHRHHLRLSLSRKHSKAEKSPDIHKISPRLHRPFSWHHHKSQCDLSKSLDLRGVSPVQSKLSKSFGTQTSVESQRSLTLPKSPDTRKCLPFGRQISQISQASQGSQGSPQEIVRSRCPEVHITLAQPEEQSPMPESPEPGTSSTPVLNVHTSAAIV